MSHFISNTYELLKEPAGRLILECLQSVESYGRSWRLDKGSVYGNRLSTLFSASKPNGQGRDRLMVVAVETPTCDWTVSYQLF